MLRLGAVGVGGVMLSSAASSVGLPSVAFRAPRTALPPVPAAPRAPFGVDHRLVERARAALDSNRIYQRDAIGIVDFSKPSSVPRFHLVDLRNGTVESHRVAHGRGSDPSHCGYLESFSNAVGSKATSNGSYVTADYYHGKYGLSMKVRGLDWSNSNAEARAIVIHNAWYAEPGVVDQTGKLGRSEGCFAFSRESQYRIMNRLGGGRMIYADKLYA